METIRITIPKSKLLVGDLLVYDISAYGFKLGYFEMLFDGIRGDRLKLNTNTRIIINDGDKDIYEKKIDIDIDICLFDSVINFETLSDSEKEICGNLNVVKFDGYYYIPFNGQQWRPKEYGYCRVGGISGLYKIVEIYNDLSGNAKLL